MTAMRKIINLAAGWAPPREVRCAVSHHRLLSIPFDVEDVFVSPSSAKHCRDK
jgi:hypothetical protein